MDLINFPIERINNFLSNHTFTIYDPLGFDADDYLDVKIKLTGTKKMIHVGDWKEYILYTVYVISGSDLGKRIFNLTWKSNSSDNSYIISTSDSKYYKLSLQLDSRLSEFLRYFSLDYRLMVNKIVNKLPESA
jgi:hypothetical protein